LLLQAIMAAIEKLSKTHAEHISQYGTGNEQRLTGKHETCDINTFRFGVADRGSSIRIPLPVQLKGYGYLEDRRPAANVSGRRCQRMASLACCSYVCTGVLTERRQIHVECRISLNQMPHLHGSAVAIECCHVAFHQV
jgi:hypothetical protein